MQIRTQIHRHPLINTIKKINTGEITLGFIGGSITTQTAWHNWPEPVLAWFSSTFPNLRITVENGAIGATGSDLAVFRAKRDLIDRGCDLVFVEYAVNDNGTPKELRCRSREGLLRQLLSDGKRDVLLVYTHMADFLPFYTKGESPDSIAEFEQLANHYNLGSIWVGLNSYREVKQGLLRFEEWLPDALHPQARGSLSYGNHIIDFLKTELLENPKGNPTPKPMPVAMNSKNWGNATILDFNAVNWKGPFKIRRWTDLEWIHQCLETSAIGATLSFEFEGRALSLGFDFGKLSSEFKWRIDGGEWKTEVRDRPTWCNNSGWFRIANLCDDLPSGKHLFELEVTHGERAECMGTRFCLGLIGVVK